MLQKKFSIGLSMDLSYEEHKKILNEYAAYIDYVYFSPPLGDVYHSRQDVRKNMNDDDAGERLYRVLDLYQQSGVKLEMALNTLLSSKDVTSAIDCLSRYFTINAVVTMDIHATHVRHRLPDAELVYSYNNCIRRNSDVDNIPSDFNVVVLGNSSLRNFKRFEYVQNKGFRIRLLLNNGCSFNCRWCHNPQYCLSTFKKNLGSKNVNELYAIQSIMPDEFHNYFANNKFIDSFKISNRPSNYKHLDRMLGSYIHNISLDLIGLDNSSYLLWCRLAHFSEHLDELSYYRILEEKEKLYT